jgi:basic membrane protein A and related proteins
MGGILVKRLLKSLSIGLLACSLLLTACGKGGTQTTDQPAGTETKTEAKKLKVALLLPGTINDNGWNATAYNGLMLIEKDLGAEVAYTEKVAQSDQEEVFRNYVAQGFNVLIGHGFEFGDAAKRVAQDNPDVKFLITSTDISQEPNLGSTSTNPMQMGFLEGVVAGLATKTNNIGGVGGMEIPPIQFAMQGFEAGVKYINPNAKVTITMTGDFDDAVKAKEAANALISKGADVVMLNADQAGLGVIEAAKGKGVYALSSIAVQHELAPDTVLGSGISDVPKAMEVVVKHILDGDYKAQFYDVGVVEGVVYFVPNPKFESIYKEKLAQVVEDIKSGKINVQELVDKK